MTDCICTYMYGAPALRERGSAVCDSGHTNILYIITYELGKCRCALHAASARLCMANHACHRRRVGSRGLMNLRVGDQRNVNATEQPNTHVDKQTNERQLKMESTQNTETGVALVRPTQVASWHLNLEQRSSGVLQRRAASVVGGSPAGLSRPGQGTDAPWAAKAQHGVGRAADPHCTEGRGCPGRSSGRAPRQCSSCRTDCLG